MPEGPSILLMKENLQKFVDKKIISASGNANVERELLNGKKLLEIKTFGKQTYLVLKEISVRIHLLMFGSYSIDEQTKPDSRLRLALHFKTGSMYFYTCSVKVVENQLLSEIDWEADVLSDSWNAKKAGKKLKSKPGSMVCDALLDQQIFSGVGNIIKNEVLFRVDIQPESLLKNIPPKEMFGGFTIWRILSIYAFCRLRRYISVGFFDASSLHMPFFRSVSISVAR